MVFQVGKSEESLIKGLTIYNSIGMVRKIIRDSEVSQGYKQCDRILPLMPENQNLSGMEFWDS